MVLGPDLVLPWASTELEDSRFKKILRYCLLLFVVLAIAVPMLPVPEVTREQQESLPPQLARVLLEEKPLPKPEPVPPKPEPKEKELPKEKEVEPVKPKPKPAPKPEPKPEPLPVDLIKKARDTAAVSGLLAFQDDLADMRDSVDTESLSNKNLSRGAAEAAKIERSIITSKAKSASGGIQTAALSRDTGGSALSGKEDTKVSSDFDNMAKQEGANAGSAIAGGRSDEAIRRIMDQNKGAIFAIYNRALRKNPALQGKYVFEMLVEPNGTISEVKLISSELNDPELAQKILSRVKLIRFPAENVIKTRVNYSFDFLPY